MTPEFSCETYSLSIRSIKSPAVFYNSPKLPTPHFLCSSLIKYAFLCSVFLLQQSYFVRTFSTLCIRHPIDTVLIQLASDWLCSVYPCGVYGWVCEAYKREHPWIVHTRMQIPGVENLYCEYNCASRLWGVSSEIKLYMVPVSDCQFIQVLHMSCF